MKYSKIVLYISLQIIENIYRTLRIPVEGLKLIKIYTMNLMHKQFRTDHPNETLFVFQKLTMYICVTIPQVNRWLSNYASG